MTKVDPPRGTGPVGRTRDRRWLIIGAAAVAAVLVLAALLAVVLRTPGATRADRHTVSGPIGGRHQARFQLAAGIPTMRVRVENLGDQLFQISTPAGAGIVPRVAGHDGVVSLDFTGLGGDWSTDVVLSSKVTWAFALGVGVRAATIDLSGGSVSAVDFAAGVDTADLSLPKPSGTVPVRLGGGANRVTVHLPGGVPAQVRVGAGAGSVTLDGTGHNGIAAGTRFPVGDYDGAHDRYDVDLATGLSTLTVDHR
jgi:hypothetical protein